MFENFSEIMSVILRWNGSTRRNEPQIGGSFCRSRCRKTSREKTKMAYIVHTIRKIRT